jgi:hypothetical protein
MLINTTTAKSRSTDLPRLTIDDGTIESLKWLGIILMTIDHINYYFFEAKYSIMFDIGRATMPLFGFVLAYNLARPNTLNNGTYPRVIKRLALFGIIASIPYIALNKLQLGGWWPLNILGTLLITTTIIFLLDKGDKASLMMAMIVFIFGGAVVEFLWFGILLCVAAWHYCKRPSWGALIVWMGAIASLFIVNGNWYALTVVPIILLAPYIHIRLPRVKNIFYIYYPAHLTVLWLAIHTM